MSGFKKYQHIERFGTTETDGINMGMCYIFPKIDGTNASIWSNDGIVRYGSRNRELSIDNDNQGFMEWAVKNDNFIELFTAFTDLRLYGEWLVPHTLKTYDKSSWRNFYVFDVMDGDRYVTYENYIIILNTYNIEYIPPLCKIKNPSYDRLIVSLEKNTYLIEDGKGTGEGVVVKNYDYQNKYGQVTWAKIVKNEFKTAHQKVNSTLEIKEKQMIEEKIVDKYITQSLVEKEKAKIENEKGWQSKDIPRLLQTVFYCLITEECWNFVKENKNPVIDFRRLNSLTIQKIKDYHAI